MTLAVSIAQSGANNTSMRNRIINGAMMIDQRNAGASVTQPGTVTYTLDRWGTVGTNASKFSIQQSTTAPAGFSNSVLLTSLAATSVAAGDYYLFRQPIEGFNTADLMFGTANAQTVTLSFWVRSSLTGSFSGALYNAAGNRCYPFSYTISSANTWEQKTVTIAGDTSGTWIGATNGIGLYVNFSLGVGTTYSGTANTWGSAFSVTGATSLVSTNGATLYITGVQLEAGTTATAFEQRLYGTELALCQRYYFFWDLGISTGNSSGPAGLADSSTVGITPVVFPVTMRVAPTSMDTSGTASDYAYRIAGGTSVACTAINFNNPKQQSVWVNGTVSSGLTTGQAVLLRGWNSSVSKGLGFSAEL